MSRERHRFERAANARSIKYQMTVVRLPLAKEIDEFDFEATPVNETLVHELAGGGFLEQQRNVVLIGGTGTGKSRQRGVPMRPRQRARRPASAQ